MDNNMRAVLRSLLRFIHPGRWETINFHTLVTATGLSQENMNKALFNLEQNKYIQRSVTENQPDFKIKLDDNEHIVTLDD